MSQIENTDLLCKARRQELSADEQRRLNDLVRSSLEARLMRDMLFDFERESRVRPGDDMLLARINARVLGAPEKVHARRRRFLTVLLAAAVLLPASLAAGWIGSVRKPQPAAPSLLVSAWTHQPAPRPKPRVRGGGTPPQIEVVPVDPDSTPGMEVTFGDEDAVPPAAPQASGSLGPKHQVKAAPSSSASELFARANSLRRQGRSADAAGLYRLLLELYPFSREVGPSRLALAKHLHAKDPAQALIQYRALAVSGGALRAEALWGISESAGSLGQRSLAEQARSDLIREFPDSSYAEVARARTSHGSH